MSEFDDGISPALAAGVGTGVCVGSRLLVRVQRRVSRDGGSATRTAGKRYNTVQYCIYHLKSVESKLRPFMS